MKKRVISLILCLLLVMPLFSACGSKEEGNVLRVCNCEDYIDEELIVEFEQEYNCKVEYSTFGTLENLYNDIKITPDRYDLICPSEYMIEKMAKEGMLQKISDNFDEDSAYLDNVSPFILDLFENEMVWKNSNGETECIADYAGCYMWGTLGLVYNPEEVADEDMATWSSLWDIKYKNVSTIKDSIRDSYFMGIAYTERELLSALASQEGSGEISTEQYRERLVEIFNDTSDEMLEKVGANLTTLKSNIYGFEVDSGKNDIASGKIDINFAWSGDAVYAMDEAENQGVELKYAIPDEGSNIWFDGWCVPSNANNVDLAIKFIDFLSRPEIVVRNMDYIGYTSGMRGDEVFENAIDWYGVCTLNESELSMDEYNELDEETQNDYYAIVNDVLYEYVYAIKDDFSNVIEKEGKYFVNITDVDENGELSTEEIEIYKADLSYFFKDSGSSDEFIVFSDTIGRQFTAQYPTEDITKRCVIMRCYDEEANGRVVIMWENVKGFMFPTVVLWLLTFLLVVIIVLAILFKFRKQIFTKEVSLKENRNRQKYKVIKEVEIR